MSQYLRETISKIKASINSLPVTPLHFNKLYDDTLFQYPDEYNADAENYHKTPNQYVTAFGKPKTHTHKGGILCGVCFDNKPASQTWFCRLCNASLCAGCYQGCKNAGGINYMPISVMDLANKNYDNWSPRAEQPKCPACRGEGTFASKGIRATRLHKYGDGEGEVARYFGPNITTDKYLQQNVRQYIKSYNEAVTDTVTTLHKYKQSYEDLQKNIMEDAEYQAFCDDINEKRGIIAEMEQTIRDINSEIYKLQLQKESFVTNKIGNEDEDELPQALSSSNTLASKYPRKFYRQHKNGEHYSMRFTACVSDKDIAEFCNFTKEYKQNVTIAYERYGVTPYQRDQETNDLLINLNKHYQGVVKRFDALNTGCIIPRLAVNTSNASAMSDNELALAIARLQQEVSKRGATKEE